MSQTSADTLIRQWTMLSAIPRAPRTASTRTIADHLRAEGYSVTDRTVQRDLEKLSAVFHFTSEADGRALRWFWPRGAAAMDLPGMDPATALTFSMAHGHLRHLLPPQTLDLLAPWFAHADAVLTVAENTALRDWREQVRALQRGPELQPPAVSGETHRTVCEALLVGRKLALRYRARWGDEAKDYDVSPLGLVTRDGVIYLVCVQEFDPFHLALHRIETAQTLDEAATRPAGFSLDEHIGTQRMFGYPHGVKPVRLRFRMDSYAARHLEERPLAEDQAMREEDEDWTVVSATVANTSELRWWLLGFGDQVEVLAPKSLRRELGQIAWDMAGMYPELGPTDRA